MKREKNEIELPSIGMFIGSGIYPMSKDYLLSTLHGHQAWMPQSFSPQEMIDKIVDDNQGNLAQFWGYSRGYAPATHAEWIYALDEIGINIPEPDWEKGTNIYANRDPLLKEHQDRFGAGALRFIREAAKKDIYTLFIYVSAKQKWADEFKNCGKYYLGYDFGERFTFRLDESSLSGKKLEEVTLKMLTDDLVKRVKEHVDERHATGWGNVMATSINFYIDYEILAGADVPLLEDFAFQHLNFASALSRGLYRQFDLPMWGSHMAHEHYSWIPNSSEHKFNMFKVGMYQKYMSGCKMIINESGNWFVEATLAMDSPKFDFPRVPLGPTDVSWGGGEDVKFIPYIEEARKHYKESGYDGEIPRRYRKEISDFYDFVKANGTPAGQPESTVAIAKGNYDLANFRYSPHYAIAGAYTLADKNAAWYESVPERGWDTVKKVFYPLVPVMEPYENAYLSGTPFGQVDIVSFAQEDMDPAFLNANYKALLFSGWNTSSEKQYDILKTYVANGGTLFISIPQLSKNMTRNFGDYSVDELVHGGDFSELCGVKVKGRGKRIYWATAPDNSEELGFKFPRRFGILAICMGDIEITDPEIEILAVDDEEADPLVLRRKYGKGQVYFLNSWAYPGAFDNDFGPGSTDKSPGLVGMIYRQIAKDSRGNVYITDDGEEVGQECEYINFSYFPEAGKIYLYNIDSKKSHSGYLHHFGKSEPFELAPGEFRQIESVVQTSSN